MSATLDYFRELGVGRDVDDATLAKYVGENYPDFLKADPEFAAAYPQPVGPDIWPISPAGRNALIQEYNAQQQEQQRVFSKDQARDTNQALWDRQANRSTDLHDRFLQDTPGGRFIQGMTSADDPWMDAYRHTPEGIATFGPEGSPARAAALEETQRYLAEVENAKQTGGFSGRRAGPAETVAKGFAQGASDVLHNLAKAGVSVIDAMPTGYEDPTAPYWETKLRDMEEDPIIRAISENQARAKTLLGVDPDQPVAKFLGETFGATAAPMAFGPLAPWAYGLSAGQQQLEEARAAGSTPGEAVGQAAITGLAAGVSERLLGLPAMLRRGAKPALSVAKEFSKQLAEEAADSTTKKLLVSAARKALKGAGEGSLREGIQEPLEGFISELGSWAVTGRDEYDPFTLEAMKRRGIEALGGATVGGPLGALFGGASRLQQRAYFEKLFNAATTPSELRLAASQAREELWTKPLSNMERVIDTLPTAARQRMQDLLAEMRANSSMTIENMEPGDKKLFLDTVDLWRKEEANPGSVAPLESRKPTHLIQERPAPPPGMMQFDPMQTETVRAFAQHEYDRARLTAELAASIDNAKKIAGIATQTAAVIVGAPAPPVQPGPAPEAVVVEAKAKEHFDTAKAAEELAAVMDHPEAAGYNENREALERGDFAAAGTGGVPIDSATGLPSTTTPPTVIAEPAAAPAPILDFTLPGGPITPVINLRRGPRKPKVKQAVALLPQRVTVPLPAGHPAPTQEKPTQVTDAEWQEAKIGGRVVREDGSEFVWGKSASGRVRPVSTKTKRWTNDYGKTWNEGLSIGDIFDFDSAAADAIKIVAIEPEKGAEGLSNDDSEFYVKEIMAGDVVLGQRAKPKPVAPAPAPAPVVVPPAPAPAPVVQAAPVVAAPVEAPPKPIIIDPATGEEAAPKHIADVIGLALREHDSSTAWYTRYLGFLKGIEDPRRMSPALLKALTQLADEQHTEGVSGTTRKRLKEALEIAKDPKRLDEHIQEIEELLANSVKVAYGKVSPFKEVPAGESMGAIAGEIRQGMSSADKSGKDSTMARRFLFLREHRNGAPTGRYIAVPVYMGSGRDGKRLMTRDPGKHPTRIAGKTQGIQLQDFLRKNPTLEPAYTARLTSPTWQINRPGETDGVFTENDVQDLIEAANDRYRVAEGSEDEDEEEMSGTEFKTRGQMAIQEGARRSEEAADERKEQVEDAVDKAAGKGLTGDPEEVVRSAPAPVPVDTGSDLPPEVHAILDQVLAEHEAALNAAIAGYTGDAETWFQTNAKLIKGISVAYYRELEDNLPDELDPNQRGDAVNLLVQSLRDFFRQRRDYGATAVRATGRDSKTSQAATGKGQPAQVKFKAVDNVGEEPSLERLRELNDNPPPAIALSEALTYALNFIYESYRDGHSGLGLGSLLPAVKLIYGLSESQMGHLTDALSATHTGSPTQSDPKAHLQRLQALEKEYQRVSALFYELYFKRIEEEKRDPYSDESVRLNREADKAWAAYAESERELIAATGTENIFDARDAIRKLTELAAVPPPPAAGLPSAWDELTPEQQAEVQRERRQIEANARAAGIWPFDESGTALLNVEFTKEILDRLIADGTNPLRVPVIESYRRMAGTGLQFPATYLTPGQWITVRTKAFMEWFGDWENDPQNASKVTHPMTGEPEVQYHGRNALGAGTPLGFTVFNPANTAENQVHFGTPVQANAFTGTGYLDDATKGPRVYPVFLNIRKPYLAIDKFGPSPALVIRDMVKSGDLTNLEAEELNDASSAANHLSAGDQSRAAWSAVIALMQSKGYDGFIYHNRSEGKPHSVDNIAWVIWNPEQAKSQFNRGTFDPKNRDIRFLYAGKKARMTQFRRDGLKTAQEMALAGKSSEEIRALTGWFINPYDKKLRWEIPDNKAKFKPDGLQRLRNGETLTLADLLDHPLLFKAYPDMKHMSIGGSTVPSPISGAYHKPAWREKVRGQYIGEVILLGGVDPEGKRHSDEDMMATMLHELQHSIQYREQFASGANPQSPDVALETEIRRQTAPNPTPEQQEQMDELGNRRVEWNLREEGRIYRGAVKSFEESYPLATVRLFRQAQANDEAGFGLSTKEESILKAFQRSFVQYRKTPEGTPKPFPQQNELDQIHEKFFPTQFGTYRSSAGEFESRDIVSRKDLTDEERARVAPYSSENIAPEDSFVTHHDAPKAPDPLKGWKGWDSGGEDPDYSPEASAQRRPGKLNLTKAQAARTLAKQIGGDIRLSTKSAKELQRTTGLTLEFIKAFEKVFGVRIVPVTGAGAAKFIGAHFGGEGLERYLFINDSHSSAGASVLAHELVHAIRVNNPVLYDQMVKELVPLLKDIPGWNEAIAKNPAYANLSEEGKLEELVAEVVGLMFKDKRFVKRLAQENPGLLQKLTQTILDYIDRIIAAFRSHDGNAAAPYIKDLVATRNVIAANLAEFAKSSQDTAVRDEAFFRKAYQQATEQGLTVEIEEADSGEKTIVHLEGDKARLALKRQKGILDQLTALRRCMGVPT